MTEPFTNVYDDGTPRPKMQTREKEDGKKENFYPDEPDFPKVRVDKAEERARLAAPTRADDERRASGA